MSGSSSVTAWSAASRRCGLSTGARGQLAGAGHVVRRASRGDGAGRGGGGVVPASDARGAGRGGQDPAGGPVGSQPRGQVCRRGVDVRVGQAQQSRRLRALDTRYSRSLRHLVRPSARQDLLEMVRSSRALLIMDNCEHLLRSVAELVGDVLAAGPELTVLATSREPLHSPGEQVVPVAPLPVADEAAVLFVDQAVALRPSFVADGENREAVLRHLPASGRNAAGDRVGRRPHSGHDPSRDRPPAGSRFQLLSERHRAEDRHSSLQRVVDWSFDLLDDEAQAVLLPPLGLLGKLRRRRCSRRLRR